MAAINWVKLLTDEIIPTIADDFIDRAINSFEESDQDSGLPIIPVLDPVVEAMENYFKYELAIDEPGRQHSLSHGYFDRIGAMQYTLAHDDGQLSNDLEEADIILVGVSRTSKTPTSMYLAHRGYKVANYALVPKVPFPQHYLDELDLFVVGLTNDPKRLSQIRRTRQAAMQDNANEDYADIDQITDEVRNARRLFASNGWPVIDVTRRSVEETAAAILQHYTKWIEARS